MRMFKAHVFGYEPTVIVQRGEMVTLDGQDYVRSGDTLCPLGTGWRATEADALVAAVPRAQEIAAQWSELVARLQEGRR